MDEKEKVNWRQHQDKPTVFSLPIYQDLNINCMVDLSDRTYYGPDGGSQRIPACDNIFETAERHCRVRGADKIHGADDTADLRAREEERAAAVRSQRTALQDIKDALDHLDRYEPLRTMEPPSNMVTADNALRAAYESLFLDKDERGWTQKAQDGAAIAAHMLDQTPPAFQNEQQHSALLCAIDAKGQMARAREEQERAPEQQQGMSPEALQAARNLVREADKAVTLMQERGIGMNEAGLSKALQSAHAAGIEPPEKEPRTMKFSVFRDAGSRERDDPGREPER